MRIVDLHGSDSTAAGAPLVEQCAEILLEAFRDFTPTAWPDLDAARAEVVEALAGKPDILLAKRVKGVRHPRS